MSLLVYLVIIHSTLFLSCQLRLDTLGQAGVPIWITELDVQAQDENKRADFYEHALRAMYGHEKVEGILWWGFWDQVHWRGMKAALVQGDNLQVRGIESKSLMSTGLTYDTHRCNGDHCMV